jgi:uncharacterized paraquat-inducible protein A
MSFSKWKFNDSKNSTKSAEKSDTIGKKPLDPEQASDIVVWCDMCKCMVSAKKVKDADYVNCPTCNEDIRIGDQQ